MNDLDQRRLQFLLNPAATLHRSWQKELCETWEGPQDLLKAHLDSPQVSRLLFQRHELHWPHLIDTDTPWKRALLLDQKESERFCLYLGFLCQREALMKVISGRIIRAVNTAGKSDVFALLQETEVSLEASSNQRWHSKGHSMALGYSLWMASLGALPKPLQMRLRLKLPQKIKRNKNVPITPNDDSIKSYISKVFPECPWLAS